MKTWSVWNERCEWYSKPYKVPHKDWPTFEEALKVAADAKKGYPNVVYSIRDSDGGKVTVNKDGSVDGASSSFCPKVGGDANGIKSAIVASSKCHREIGLTMEVGFAGTNRKVGKAASMWRDEIAEALRKNFTSVADISNHLADAVMRDVFGVGVEKPKVKPEAEPDRNGDVAMMSGNNLAGPWTRAAAEMPSPTIYGSVPLHPWKWDAASMSWIREEGFSAVPTTIKFTHGFTTEISNVWGPVNTAPSLVLHEEVPKTAVLDSMDSEPCPKCEDKGQVYSDFNAMWLPCRACGGKS